MLTGDNGILQRAGEAKTNTEKANEKEQIQIEVIGSYETNGTLKVDTVKNNINNHISNATATSTTTDSGESFPITVEFSTTGNKYTVENNGNVDLFVLKNTTWQDNVTYDLDKEQHTIKISRSVHPTHVGEYIGNVLIKKKAVIDEIEYTTTFPSNCDNLFSNYNNMTSFSMEDIDTSNVTNMNYMFCSCSSLENVDLSYLDTVNVTVMDYMFDGCSSLNELDLSSFKVNNVSSMRGMFGNVSAKLNLSGWVIKGPGIVNNVSSQMSELFSGCMSKEIIARDWDVSSIGDLSCMFANYGTGVTILETVDISNWTFGSNHVARRFFYHCHSLTTIIGINEWQLSNFNLNDYTPCFYEICGYCTALNNKLTGGIWDNGTWSDGTFSPST